MATCLTPFFIKDDAGKQVLVPCSKCETCKARRVSSWSFRLMQELKNSITAKFITLTYDDNTQPFSKNGFRTLRKRDMQLFFKRLRKIHSKMAGYKEKPIRYFYVGEYGGKIRRPHYHCILFNADYRKIQDTWAHGTWICNTKTLKRKSRNGITHRITQRKTWKHNGFIHYGNKQGVCEASIGYCCRYMLKPKNPRIDPYDDREKEKAYMSKGLGISYLNEKMMRWHHHDLKNRMYVNLPDNKKASMPRYYKDKLYNKKEREAIKKHTRDQLTEKILDDLFKMEYGQAYNQARDKSERIKTSKLKQQKLLLCN